MGSRNHLKSDALVFRNLKKVVLEKHRKLFGRDAVVRIEPTGFRKNLDLIVVSSKVSHMPWDKSITMIMDWIREDFPPTVHNRIISVWTLSPAEARRLFGRVG